MYKKLSLFAIGTAVIATPVLAAPGGAKGDADRSLTRAEAQTRAAEMFAKMDVNNDGKIDAADRAARRAEMNAKRFAGLDANGDGSISRAEWDNHNADRAAKRSARAATGETGDGKRQAMRGPGKRGGHHAMGGRMMRGADGDKAITLAEFQAAALARFDAADTNKDGVVTAEERQAQRAAWRAQRGAAKPNAQ